MTALTDNAITKIVGLADERRTPSTLTDPRTGRTVLVQPDGTIRDPVRGGLTYRAHTTTGLLGLAQDLVPHYGQARAFVGEQSVAVVLDERGEAIDTLRMELHKAEGFKALDNGALHDIGQGQLLWVLRSLFPDAVAPAEFLPTLRSLRFKQSSDGKSDVSQGRETRDLAVERALLTDAGGEIAEQIVLSTPVFVQLAAEKERPVFEVACAVRVDVAERTFTIKPLEGELLRATTEALDWIATRLETAAFGGREADWQVYRDAYAAVIG